MTDLDVHMALELQQRLKEQDAIFKEGFRQLVQRAERAEAALTEERTRHKETVAMCEQLKEERDKAQAACAAITAKVDYVMDSCRTNDDTAVGDYLIDSDRMLELNELARSTTCGQGWLSPEQVKELQDKYAQASRLYGQAASDCFGLTQQVKTLARSFEKISGNYGSATFAHQESQRALASIQPKP